MVSTYFVKRKVGNSLQLHKIALTLYPFHILSYDQIQNSPQYTL